ncbi:unnamed protein product [Adineta ricciae]|uniref:Uncharacterized protein n=1 Tax=Adineta ricciae TaxID=249248 RepID=A0A813RFH9_ADIRI|nr:unnamed protein product [Adineta ricciae]CAF1166967.1 unnamed protein product [Adineta ricciae]
MSADHKSTKQITISFPKANDVRLKLPPTNYSHPKSRTIPPHPSVASQIPKTSIIYPTLLPRSSTSYYSNHQPCPRDARYLYVVNASGNSHRTPSTQTPSPNSNSLPLPQQFPTLNPSTPPRPYLQYGHFLAYLRRQSLARLRRKQEQQELDGTESVDTAITLTSNKTPSYSLQSMSNLSLGTSTTDAASMPAIPIITSKQKSRPTTSQRPLQRSSSLLTTNYRLNLNQALPFREITSLHTLKETSVDNHSLVLPSKPIVSATPANSVINATDASSPSNRAPYEVQLTGDTLSYCFVSDSGVTYQGQLLSSAI